MPRASSHSATTSRKRPANVTVNDDLLTKARRHGINLSQALEDRLVELIGEKERDKWLQDNRAAIEAYNRRIDREGVFSDGLRTF
jgi:antitoxin CcdA